MSIHTHTVRDWCAWVLVLVPIPFLLGWAFAPDSNYVELAQVSGRVTCADEPVSGTIFFMPDDQGSVNAMGPVKPDGSFQLYVNGALGQRGAVPGRYRVVVLPRVPGQAGSRINSKYQDARTTDLLVHLGPDWNYVRFDLH